MATGYTKHSPYKGPIWDVNEETNSWQQSAIGNIENFLSNVQWDKLGGNTDTSRLDNLTDWNKDRMTEIGSLESWNRDRMSEIGRLEQFNRDRLEEIQGINTRTDANTADLRALETIIDNWNTTTQVSDVPDIGSTLDNLLQKYNFATKSDLVNTPATPSGVNTNLPVVKGTLGGPDLSGYLTDEDLAKKGFLTLDNLPGPPDLEGYMKTSDFNTRMTERLGALKDTLRGEWGADIPTLDLSQVNQDIAAVGGDLSKLTNKFAGLSSNVDWLKDLDLGGLEGRIGTDLSDLETSIAGDRRGDLTDLKGILETGRGEALKNLQDTMGRDRAADLLELREKIDKDRLSDTEALAGNLRHEFGKQVFDLSDTYDQRLGDLQSSLGGDISKLFTKSGDLDSGIAALTSGLGTTSQQLEALRESFGDYKTDAATNLDNVRSAFSDTVGDLGTDFTKRLGDLGSSTARDILGIEKSFKSDLAGARSDAALGLAGARSDAALGLAGLRTDAAADVASARSDAAAGLAGLRTSTAADVASARSEAASGIAGARSDAAAGIAGARSDAAAGIAGARSEAALGIAGAREKSAADVASAREASVAGDVSLRSELTDARQKAISDLDTTWSGRLSDSESRFTREQARNKADFDRRLSDISSSLNYKTLDDSAQGVKIRRSRAYQSGRTRSGTSQLGRSMKLNTLNI